MHPAHLKFSELKDYLCSARLIREGGTGMNDQYRTLLKAVTVFLKKKIKERDFCTF